MALAHAVGNKVEAAYRRGDLFEKRRRLMDDWAAYCSMPSAAQERRYRRIARAEPMSRGPGLVHEIRKVVTARHCPTKTWKEHSGLHLKR